MERRETFLPIIEGNANWSGVMENKSFLKQLEIVLIYNPTILFLCIYPKERESRISESILIPMYIKAL